MGNLFAYGTLMCEEIIVAVAGCRLPHEPGILNGYKRRAVKGEHYPAITPAIKTEKPSRVDGVVYRNVSSPIWDRLDRFEGDMYARHSVDVELNDGTMVPAETYVVKPAYLNCLDQSDWDYEHFLKTGKPLFQQHYKGYRHL